MMRLGFFSAMYLRNNDSMESDCGEGAGGVSDKLILGVGSESSSIIVYRTGLDILWNDCVHFSILFII